MKIYLDCFKIKELRQISVAIGINRKLKSKNDYIDAIYKATDSLSLKNTIDLLNLKYITPIVVQSNKKINNYNINDIKYSYDYYNIRKNEYDLNNFKKKELFDYLKKVIIILTNHKENIDEITHIQKNLRRYLVKKMNDLQGPALFNKNLCNNHTDFATYEKLTDIPSKYFISYIDPDDKFIYGFDIRNILQMIGLNVKFQNPYTRKDFPKSFKNNIEKFKNILNKINITVTPDSSNIITLNQRIVNVFSEIDQLGFYTNINWFNSLSLIRLKQFYKHLEDIWNWRLNLSFETKLKIVPPHGNPFRYGVTLIMNITSFLQLRKICIKLINKLVTSANETEDRKLGAIYVLMALTIVNHQAAAAMPAIYNSVALY